VTLAKFDTTLWQTLKVFGDSDWRVNGNFE